MPTYSMRKRTRRNDHPLFLLSLAGGILLCANFAVAQLYLPKSPPPPPDYGKVILDNHSAAGPAPVVFDHWLHRSKFTCRVCHVDVGFAMAANATGVTANSNRQGFYCGACHDGKKVFEGTTVFAACSDSAYDKQCDRCHSLGKKGVRKYEYATYTAPYPKSVYGVNWEQAEASGLIKPVDFIAGLSVKKAPMASRQDFSLEANLPWVHPIIFSHKKHAIWNGCELCHPEIFPPASKGAVHYTMFSNVEGQHCGACHGKVASPLNNCQKCHSDGPLWAP
jgi:c(7)-type cytochrome triheme protein